ncbi:MAG TPA: hypothetical protein VKF59_03800 [Candidatus Dormibacteraeota bacterium]|nr:hypothetical protein [Candidatus Dormibacteraeota bacterium]
MDQQAPFDPDLEPYPGWAAGMPAPGPQPPAAAARRPRLRRAVAWAVAATLVAGAAGLVGALALDDARSHQAAAQQADRARSLAAQLALARGEDQQLTTQVSALRADNTQLQDEARSPTLSMWNSCGGPCTVGPGFVRVGSVPDTFQLQIDFTADVPVRTYVFTFHQWTQFDGCSFDLRCVTGSYRAFDAATSLTGTFDDAEGCSGYIWVLQADRPGTIKPDVRVRYQPAAHPTGVCAESP